jgi:hypothetical protein
MKLNHTNIVTEYMENIPPNKITQISNQEIHKSEENLSRDIRTTLAQLRTNKSSFLLSYLNHINPTKYPSPLCPLCKTGTHDTSHIFTCPKISTQLTPNDLWNNPERVGELIVHWRDLLGSLE